MRYFSALCARMYRFSVNSRATISSTAIFLSQQLRQYRSSPRGSVTSLAPQMAHLVVSTVFRAIEGKLYRSFPESRQIRGLRVFLQHASGRESRRDSQNGLLDHRDPAL